MPVKVTLKEYLTQRNLSTYKLVQATTGRVAERTVYALARPGVKRVDLETLGVIIEALHDLTGETVTPNDLLEVIEEPVFDLPVSNLSVLEMANAQDAVLALKAAETTVGSAELEAWLEATQRAVKPLEVRA
jgi:DNA-binding Xre family transcriptional regulator